MSEWLTIDTNVYKPQPKLTIRCALSTPIILESSFPTSLITSCGARWLSGAVELCATDLHAENLFTYRTARNDAGRAEPLFRFSLPCAPLEGTALYRKCTIHSARTACKARLYKHQEKISMRSGLRDGLRTGLLKRNA
jgi:hypothetical protein